jgi:hypothetical protein
LTLDPVLHPHTFGDILHFGAGRLTPGRCSAPGRKHNISSPAQQATGKAFGIAIIVFVSIVSAAGIPLGAFLEHSAPGILRLKWRRDRDSNPG